MPGPPLGPQLSARAPGVPPRRLPHLPVLDKGCLSQSPPTLRLSSLCSWVPGSPRQFPAGPASRCPGCPSQGHPAFIPTGPCSAPRASPSGLVDLEVSHLARVCPVSCPTCCSTQPLLPTAPGHLGALGAASTFCSPRDSRAQIDNPNPNLNPNQGLAPGQGPFLFRLGALPGPCS